MSVRDIPASLRRQDIERARERCEYCRMPDSLSFYPPEIDHIIARKHGGQTTLENLARVCWRCNHHKGTDLTSFDPQTNELTRLFDPRKASWEDTSVLKARSLSRIRLLAEQRFSSCASTTRPDWQSGHWLFP